jgi:hypothetical protein
MAQFKTFVGDLEQNKSSRLLVRNRLCDDVCCRSFREARAKALALYKEKRNDAKAPFAMVVCENYSAFIASGIRGDVVHHCGHGYSVDVTPSRGVAMPGAEDACYAGA